jgi:hypothetical protein
MASELLFVKDYRAELDRLGQQPFLSIHSHPVLVMLGLAGTLKISSGLDRTLIAENSQEAVTLGQLVGRVFPIIKAKFSPPGPITLGRTNDNDIAITESSISKRHCYFTVVAGEIKLFDCGSTNGSTMDGAKLEPKKPYSLKGGELLVLGRFAVSFHRAQGFVEYLRTAA